MDQLRYFLGLLAKHLDVQIALLMAPEFNQGLPPSLVGNQARKVNMGLKGLQISGNSIMPVVGFLGGSLVDRFPTHAEQFNQNVNSLGLGSAVLARQSIDTACQYMGVALMVATQAVDLRTYSTTGRYDAREMLSPATVPLYEAVRDVVGKPPSAERPYIWNDSDQFLSEHIGALADGHRAPEDAVAAAVERSQRSCARRSCDEHRPGARALAPARSRPRRHRLRRTRPSPTRSSTAPRAAPPTRCASSASAAAIGSRCSCPTFRPSPSPTSATQKLGAIAVSLNSLLKRDEVRFILDDSQPKVVVTTAAQRANVPDDELAAPPVVLIAEGEATRQRSIPRRAARARVRSSARRSRSTRRTRRRSSTPRAPPAFRRAPRSRTAT